MADDSTLAEVFEQVAGEPIQAAVIGVWSEYGTYGDSEPRDANVDPVRGRVISWAEARPLLDYQWAHGFGGADCHPVYAWTENKIVLVSEYDGSTAILWLPRNPVDHLPKFDGMDMLDGD